MSIQSMEHVTAAEWARKEIAGAATYREWVGEGDETITLRGQLFPLFMKQHGRAGGFTGDQSLEWLENARRLGVAQLLMRGDGTKLGWYIIESISRGHTHIAADGIGQMITFDAKLQRVPNPNPQYYLQNSMMMQS